MANRTGTQLKSDASAGDTALAAAVASPSDANLQALLTAFNAVAQNGRDSAFSFTTSDGAAQRPAVDIAALAEGAAREILYIMRTAANASNAERSALLKQLQTRLNLHTWASVTSKPTTN